MTQPNSNGNGVVEKSGPVSEQALRRSVQQEPPGQGPFYSGAEMGIFWLAQQLDEIEAWGRNIKLRDQQLRAFVPVEPLFNSALGIIASRNAAFAWKLEGPPRVITKYQRVFQTANFGRGWADLMLKFSVDLYTQDSGAFIEVIRERNSENSEVVGVANLDAARCYPTGHPEVPVVYLDRNGAYHYLKWYQVIHVTEMPAAYEGIPGLQYCALTRMLRSVRVIRDIAIYLSEKVGGRNPRSITAVKGITPGQMTDAWNQAQSLADSSGLTRFMKPIIVGSTDPKADVAFATLDLASLPDGFDIETTNKWYISQIAMAFLEDYQTFAPLPGGGLGTSTQSEVLHAKSRGKGPGLFMKLVAEALNWNVLPDSVEFLWDEQDPEADAQEANTRLVRGQDRAARIASGELTPQIARDIAVADGDLTKEQLDALATEDILNDAIARENQRQDEILASALNQLPGDAVEPEAVPGSTDEILEEGAQSEAQNPKGEVDDEDLDEEDKKKKKHLSGQHDQMAHAHGASGPSGEGGRLSSPSRENPNPWGSPGYKPPGFDEADPVMQEMVVDVQKLGRLSNDEAVMIGSAVQEIQNSPLSSLPAGDRVGERPAVSLEKTQAAAVKAASDDIRQRYQNDGQEHATIIREDGSRGPVWDGEGGSVNVDSWHAANAPLAIHTHPNDLGLSIDDVATAMTLNVREIRSIGPTKTHIARVNTVRTDGKPNWDQAAAARTYNAKFAVEAVKASRKYTSTGGLAPGGEDDEKIISRVWKATAKAGNFTYEVRPS